VRSQGAVFLAALVHCAQGRCRAPLLHGEQRGRQRTSISHGFRSWSIITSKPNSSNPAPCRGTLGHSASSVSTITCCTRWKTALSSIPASARYLRKESHHTASCSFRQLQAASGTAVGGRALAEARERPLAPGPHPLLVKAERRRKPGAARREAVSRRGGKDAKCFARLRAPNCLQCLSTRFCSGDGRAGALVDGRVGEVGVQVGNRALIVRILLSRKAHLRTKRPPARGSAPFSPTCPAPQWLSRRRATQSALH